MIDCNSLLLKQSHRINSDRTKDLWGATDRTCK